MDKLAPQEYQQAYIDDPFAWWGAHGLEYFCDSSGYQPITAEFAGVSLDILTNEYRDYTFEDVRMMVFNAFKEISVKLKYKHVKWYQFSWLETIPEGG